MMLTSFKQVRKLPTGSTLIIRERLGQVCCETLVLKRHVAGGIVLAPHKAMELERLYRVDQKSFRIDPKGFALASELGRIAVRIQIP